MKADLHIYILLEEGESIKSKPYLTEDDAWKWADKVNKALISRGYYTEYHTVDVGGMDHWYGEVKILGRND